MQIRSHRQPLIQGQTLLPVQRSPLIQPHRPLIRPANHQHQTQPVKKTPQVQTDPQNEVVMRGRQ
jgi:hypothetical protein